MPKQCLAPDCTYNVFGKGYCLNHQYLRTDKNKPKFNWVQSNPIKKVSKKRQTQEQIYKKLKSVHLDTWTLCQFRPCGNSSTEIHHMNGRNGDRLIDVEYFMAICRNCHTWIHEHPKEARKKGYLI